MLRHSQRDTSRDVDNNDTNCTSNNNDIHSHCERKIEELNAKINILTKSQEKRISSSGRKEKENDTISDIFEGNELSLQFSDIRNDNPEARNIADDLKNLNNSNRTRKKYDDIPRSKSSLEML